MSLDVFIVEGSCRSTTGFRGFFCNNDNNTNNNNNDDDDTDKLDLRRRCLTRSSNPDANSAKCDAVIFFIKESHNCERGQTVLEIRKKVRLQMIGQVTLLVPQIHTKTDI